MSCKICGSSRLKKTDTSKLQMVFSDGKKAPSVPFVYQCKDCNSLIKDLTPEWKFHVDNNYKNQYVPSTNSDIVKPGAHLNRIKDVLDNLDFESSESLVILDYGMGNGDLSKYILQNFNSANVDGFDPYAHDIGSYLHDSNRFRFFSDEKQFLSSPISYDYIILLQSFEHIAEPHETILKLHSKLKPKGSIFLQITSPYLNPVDLVVYDGT